MTIAVFISTSVWQQLASRELSPYDARFRENEVGFYAWALFTLTLGGGYCFAIWRSHRASSDRGPEISPSASPPSAPGLLWLMLVPVLITGVSPYIGLKTQGTLSMFSNLRTEGSSNHLLLDRIDLFPYQADVVQVLGSDHRGFANWAARQRQVTYFEFRRVLSSLRGDLRVDFIRNGERHSVRRADARGADAEIFKPQPWWERKFLAFRRLPDPNRAMPCRW